MLLCGVFLVSLYNVDSLIWGSVRLYLRFLQAITTPPSVSRIMFFCLGFAVLNIFQTSVGPIAFTYWIRLRNRSNVGTEVVLTRNITITFFPICSLATVFISFQVRRRSVIPNFR